MRILLTKGTPSAPKSQSRFIHIHKSLGKSCLCSLEPARGTGRKKTVRQRENGEKDVRKAEEQIQKNVTSCNSTQPVAQLIYIHLGKATLYLWGLSSVSFISKKIQKEPYIKLIISSPAYPPIHKINTQDQTFFWNRGHL